MVISMVFVRIRRMFQRMVSRWSDGIRTPVDVWI